MYSRSFTLPISAAKRPRSQHNIYILRVYIIELSFCNHIPFHTACKYNVVGLTWYNTWLKPALHTTRWLLLNGVAPAFKIHYPKMCSLSRRRRIHDVETHEMRAPNSSDSRRRPSSYLCIYVYEYRHSLDCAVCGKTFQQTDTYQVVYSVYSFQTSRQ